MRHYTIWQFRSVDGKQVVRCARQSEPFEPQHEYQRVLDRVMAWNPKDALAKSVAS